MADEAAFNQAMRRKLRSPGGPSLQQGAERAWPLALARAARDRLALGLDVTALAVSRPSLAEFLELVPDRAMIGVLEGPKDGLGVIALSPGLLAGLIEVQTMGRVSPGAVQPRRPTRTDAAMVADWIDAALLGFESSLAADADLPWADGFRYASFLDDPRPLGLLLDDVPYRLLAADVSLALGVRTGTLHLMLPAEGRGRRPQVMTRAAQEAEARLAFTAHLAEEAMTAECALNTVIARLTLPLSAVLSLSTDQVIALPGAALDRIAVEAVGGRPMASGRLGQHRGQRAVRLTALQDAAVRPTHSDRAASEPPAAPELALRATG